MKIRFYKQKLFLISLFFFITSTYSSAQIKGWTFLGLENEVVKSIIVHPRNPKIIYAGANIYPHNPGIGGVFKSIDGGANWDTTGLMRHDIWKLDINLKDPDVIYAASFCQGSSLTAVLKTTDGGRTWYSCLDSLNISWGWELGVITIAVSPTQPDTVYAGITGLAGGALYRSSDGGNSWFGLLPYPNNPCEVIAINPVEANILFIHSAGGIKRSVDKGHTWERVYYSGTNIWCIELDKKSPNIIYAGVASRGVLKSIDNGSTWLKKNEGLLIEEQYVPWINATAIHPQHSDIIYLGTLDHGIFYSYNGGELWRPVRPQIPDSSVLTVIFYNNDELLVGTESGIWRGSHTTAVENKSKPTIINAETINTLDNYPNPFNENTTIEFEIKKREMVKLQIYDLSGRLVRDFEEMLTGIGSNKISWDGKNQSGDRISSGIYYGILSTKSEKKSLKMILLQ